MQLQIIDYLLFSFTLFLIGLWGLYLNRKNIIIMLMSIELLLLSVNLNFIYISLYLDDATGFVFSIFILSIAAAESAIGLAILVILYNIRKTISVEYINIIKG